MLGGTLGIKSCDMDEGFIKQILATGGESIKKCFQCGTCTGSCPSGRVTAFRTRKLIRKALLGLRKEVLTSDDLWLCTTCYTCYERCPRGVNAPAVILAIRNIAVREGIMADAHRRTAVNVIKGGHVFPLDEERKVLRKSLNLPEAPPTTLKFPKALHEVQTIIKTTGFDNLVKS